MGRRVRIAWLGALLVVLGLSWGGSVRASDPETPSNLSGDWLAPAEDADDVDAIITLSQDHGIWHGHIKSIVVTRAHQHYTDESLCTACTGPRQGHPFKGLEVIWDLQAQDGKLQGGHILDPSDGSLYDCEIEASDDGRHIAVLAYKGLRVFGHTMIWRRP
jgi:uncharacterized protein (DUF2147 family)